MISPGTVVGGYRIDSVISTRGGMGIVYAALHLQLDRRVALKLLAPDLTRDPSFRKRFEREGKLHASLDHPNIVPVHDAQDSEHGPFIAMALIEGRSLEEHLEACGALDPAAAVALLRPIADALDYAHSEGLVHRDLKPANVLLTGRSRPYLTDFGITQAADATGLTRTGEVFGTPHYAAPEQFRGGEIGPWTDIYAFGAVAYECLVGSPPFPHADRWAVMRSHLDDNPPVPSIERPGLPPAVDAPIRAALAKEPEQRPKTAASFVELVEERIERSAPPPAELSGESRHSEPSDAEHEARSRRPSPRTRTVHPQPSSRSTLGGDDIAAPPRRRPHDQGRGGKDSPGGASQRPPADRRRISRAWLATAPLLLLLLIAGGFALGSALREPQQALGNAARSQSLSLRYPPGWTTRLPAKGPVSGLPMDSPIVLDSGRDTVITAGMTDVSGTTLLPKSFRRRLPSLPPPDRVELGDFEALSYPSLEPRGTLDPMSLFAIPATTGVATLTCTPASSPACKRIVATVELLRGEPFPVGPHPEYGSALSTVWEALNARTAQDEKRLARASAARAQARALRALASDYAAALSRLREIEASPQFAAIHDAIEGAAKLIASTYGELAGAAASESVERFRDARPQLRRASAKLRAAVRRLGDAGYSIER